MNKVLSPFKTSLSIHSLLPIVLFVCMLPHLTTISPALIFFILFLLSWFFLHTLAVISLPGRFLRFALVVIALLLLVFHYGFLFSQKASLTLLCMMISIKFFEIKNEQDSRNIFLILFLGYFILITHFLYSQKLLLTLYSFVILLFLTLLLLAFNRIPQNPLPIKKQIQLVSKVAIKAFPIAIVLFLFFPRIPGPLWSLPDDGLSGTTGISDKMYPGSVSQLVDSDEIAFRVDFQGTPPKPQNLYWRGPVLTETDGFLWTQKEQSELFKPFNQIITNKSQAITYTVTLEPHKQKWLYSLEMPSQVRGDTIKGLYMSNDLQLLNTHNIKQLTQYQVTSMLEFKFNQNETNELILATKLPTGHNPKTQALGKKWQSSLNTDQEIVSTALNYFRDQPFFYTKRPDAMLDDPSDQFLFEKRRGFCEHFASSFVLLMRAAQIPARVVTGYQGIEKNEIGDYYVVRQSNAHAWAEVWLTNKGWVRVDPTAMIPPHRIEQDIFDNPERLNFSALNLPDLPSLTEQQKSSLQQLWNQLKQSMDSLKHHWNQWILGFDKTKQMLFLKLMGLEADWKTLIILLLSSLITIMLFWQFVNITKKIKQTDKIYHYYQKFIQKLNSHGMSLTNHDAPEYIKQQAGQFLPDKKAIIYSIINDYLMIRYASNDNELIARRFIRQVKRF